MNVDKIAQITWFLFKFRTFKNLADFGVEFDRCFEMLRDIEKAFEKQKT